VPIVIAERDAGLRRMNSNGLWLRGQSAPDFLCRNHVMRTDEVNRPVQACRQAIAAKITKTVGASKSIEALAVLCHACSVHGELFKLPHVEKIFCSLYVAFVNSR
jgi:hypothetical protein